MEQVILMQYIYYILFIGIGVYGIIKGVFYFTNSKKPFTNPYSFRLNGTEYTIDVRAMRKNELKKFIATTEDEKLKAIAEQRLSTF